MDGLRAVAATSIVVFHALHAADFQHSQASHVFGNYFWYLSTGVHLFFVLSGFLLFLPYARAMLLNRELPNRWRFYRRRALRILPAYLVALVILAWLPIVTGMHPASGLSVITHLLMIHDMFPAFNRDIDGPFWTLAIEAQFYLLLPFIAALLARIVGASRSVVRLLGGIALLTVLALCVRGLDILLTDGMPRATRGGIESLFVLATMGTQGKYLEVFFMGMIISVIYVATVEMEGISSTLRHRLAWLVLLASVIIMLLAVPHTAYATPTFQPDAGWGVGALIYPMIVGIGYATLLLAIVWASRPIRWFFETPPVRFVGLISYSLYLWHLPVILAMIPLFAGVSLPVRVLCGFGVAYLSYQLVERPFLKRRNRHQPPRDAVPAPELAFIEDHAMAGMRQ
ncbi:MAG TPA: acyltransferase [Ktedonobacterales bacterium]|nr:acyltransferase [Ktedonobacterales bacterium]